MGVRGGSGTRNRKRRSEQDWKEKKAERKQDVKERGR